MVNSFDKPITRGPVCPNHGEPLDCGFPMKPKGYGICPVSGYSFAYEAEVDESSKEVKLDKFGNKMPVITFKLSGKE